MIDKTITFTITIRPYNILLNLLIIALFTGVFTIYQQTKYTLHYSVLVVDTVYRPKPIKRYRIDYSLYQDIKPIPTAFDIVKTILATTKLNPKYLDVTAKTIVDESRRNNFDPLFILSIIDIESRFNHRAVSPTYARGLMQVIKGTWRDEAKRQGLVSSDYFNPEHNVKIGVGYLKWLSKNFHRPDTLLLAYNQGPGGARSILSHRKEPSPEAKRYSRLVIKTYKKLLDRYNIQYDNVRAHYNNLDNTILSTRFVRANLDTQLIMASL
jgi:soluble lytic murein transglycosylase